MSDRASASLDQETGRFRVDTASGESRTGLSEAEAFSLAAAINEGILLPSQLSEVGPREYVQSGKSRQWDSNSPAGTPAAKG